jgi:hypothetical protein
MQTINTLSLTENVKNWLANSRQPTFLHVFDNACNLINEHKEVLSIVRHQIGNGPFNLVVQDEVLFSEHLTVESTVSILDNQLIIGDLLINLDNTNIWNPRPDWEVLHARRSEILNQLTKLPITDYQPLLPNSLTSDFSSALVKADVSTAKSLTSQLAGLGQGLTPAGDDFIMGAIHATWIIHPFDVASVLAKEITNTAALFTTSLSAAWIRSAGREEAGILWHEFFDALIAGDTSNIQLQADKILSVGETSGADALAGFLSLFK